jgi:hypothetical protein
MGAFVLFPILLFTIFITAVLGFFDYVHAEILVHAAAQTAVAAAVQDATAPTGAGVYASTSAVPVAVNSANVIVSQLLTGRPYIKNWTCADVGTQYSCVVHFTVSMPILGYVNATTSASATPLLSTSGAGEPS